MSFIKRYIVDSRKHAKTHYDFYLRMDRGKSVDSIVKFSLISSPSISLGLLQEPDVAQDTGVRIASPLDLLCGKLYAMHTRNEAKDFIDVAVLIENGASLQSGYAGLIVYAQNNQAVSNIMNLQGITGYLQNSKDIASRIKNCGDESLASMAQKTAETLALAAGAVDLDRARSMAEQLKLFPV